MSLDWFELIVIKDMATLQSNDKNMLAFDILLSLVKTNAN